MEQQTLTLKGFIKLESFNQKGELIDTSYVHNIVTNFGKAEVVNLLGNVSSPVAFTFLGTGSGSTTELATDLALQTENTANGSARKAATVSRVTTSVTNDTLQLAATWTFSGSVIVREIGAFNAISSGIMLGRKVLSADRTYANGESLTVTYQFQVS